MIEGVGFKWFTTNNSYIDDNNLLGPIGPTSGNFLYASAKSGIPGEETFITSPSFTNDVNGTCMIFSFSLFVSILRDEKVIIGKVPKKIQGLIDSLYIRFLKGNSKRHSNKKLLFK